MGYIFIKLYFYRNYLYEVADGSKFALSRYFVKYSEVATIS